MSEFLVKKLIKNYTKTDQVSVRTAYGVLASVVGILCNLLLFGVKLAIGIIINSISIQADAVNNLSDAGSSIVSLIGVKLAERPADKEHPFGHGRIEYIAALIVSFLILLVGTTLFKSSFVKILHPEELGFSIPLLVILIISVLLKIWLSIFNRKLGKMINSNVLKATSADARNDVLVTSVTIISILFARITGVSIDGWMGVCVSLFVIYAGFNIAKDTLLPLLGEAVDKEVYQELTEIIESYDGIVGSHDLIVHNYGPSHIMATIHVEVSNSAEIGEIHSVIDEIERDVLREKGIILVIHMDPVELEDAKVLHIKQKLLTIVKEYEKDADIHDFRVKELDDRDELKFDLVVPYTYSKEDKEEFQKKIHEAMRLVHPRCYCIITIENSFVAE